MILKLIIVKLIETISKARIIDSEAGNPEKG